MYGNLQKRIYFRKKSVNFLSVKYWASWKTEIVWKYFDCFLSKYVHSVSGLQIFSQKHCLIHKLMPHPPCLDITKFKIFHIKIITYICNSHRCKIFDRLLLISIMCHFKSNLKNIRTSKKSLFISKLVKDRMIYINQVETLLSLTKCFNNN